MAKKKIEADRTLGALAKLPTGISGFDEITGGGLPEGRIALITGGPGSGKTLFSMEFLVHGAVDFGEPGLFVAFEETAEELEKNVASLGFDLKDLERRKKLLVDYIPIERSEIEETGDYDLEGLFIRLGMMIDSIGAKRVVLDTLEALFSGFPNELILRAELRRLFRWLKSKGVTSIVTAEKGGGALTRHGLEEYVSDCVIVLDHLVKENVATRRLRVVKYRGSRHGTNEYPFLIGSTGLSILPITSLELNYNVSSERISSGVPRLDTMLGAKGFYRGSSILVSGTAGTGKSSFAATFVDSVCRRGESCLYLAFEESQHQIIRNMRSIGIDLEQWVRKGLLHFHTVRPTLYGLEAHLVSIHDLVVKLQPSAVVFDPISNLISVGDTTEVKSMLTRLIDYLKMCQVTTFFTNLSIDAANHETADVGVSSLMDAWIVLRDTESEGERNRVIHIMKARGMPHSNQLREFLLTDNGVVVKDVYIGEGRAYTGSARVKQEAQDLADEIRRKQDVERKVRENERSRKVIEAQIIALQAQLERQADEAEQYIEQEKSTERLADENRRRLAASRHSDDSEPAPEGRRKNGRRQV
ncbi:MAG TPA: circadian clock protein KaiC [bacterium]